MIVQVEFDIDRDQHRVHIVLRGRFALQDIRELVRRVHADADWSPSMSALVDLRDAIGLDFSTAAFMDLAHLLKYTVKTSAPGRTAIVVSTDFMYGLGRMWEAYSSNTKYASRVFRQYEAAEAWLDEEPSRVSDIAPAPGVAHLGWWERRGRGQAG